MKLSRAPRRRIVFPVGGANLQVSGLIVEPARVRFLYVMAHGAGAGMEHPFLERLAEALAGLGVATLRYQFPYMQVGRKRPDPPQLLQATVRAALETAVDEFSGVPVLAGGKSMGGRMTSSAAARKPLAGIAGLAFLGFPLHPPGKPGTARADHLAALDLPMLFLQGTRDAFARLDILRPVCERLGRRATLHIVEGGDHSFNVLKRSGRKPEEVMEEVAGALAEWADNATQSTPT